MMIRMMRFLCVAGLIGGTLLSQPASAFTFNFTPASNWVGFLNNPSALNPGDTIIFGGGTYSTTSRISVGHIGTADMPITLVAKEGETPIFTRPDANQNVFNFEGAQYVTMKGLEITGGSAGIRMSDRNGTQSKFITLDGNHIHHVGNAAVAANISGKTYEGMHFLNNDIHHTSAEGEGFYLGCNNNACQFYDGIIERNYIHDLDGPGVTQGDGIEIKDGSYNNIIRDNVIHDTKQPGILVYGVEEQGGPNIIEGNAIWNAGDNAIQAAADAIIQNNLIFSSSADGIHSQNHQGAVPGNLTIRNNTIQTSNNAIDIGSPNGGVFSGPIEIANNALYPLGTFAIDTFLTTGITSSGNVGTGASSGLAFDATGNLINDFVNFAAMDAFPKTGGKLIGVGDSGLQAADDFNTTSRTGSADVGAYVYDAAGNPGWQVGPGFKQFPAPPSGITGDYNDSGLVEQGDLDLVLLNWGAAWPPEIPGWVNDQPTDGFINQDDLDGVLLNWGNTSTAAAGVVPEPTSLVLLSLAGLLALSRRTRGSLR